jgi:hypothetical protein
MWTKKRGPEASDFYCLLKNEVSLSKRSGTGGRFLKEIEKFCKLSHPSKQRSGKILTPFGIIILDKLLQKEKQLYPKLLTPSGIVILIKLVQ